MGVERPAEECGLELGDQESLTCFRGVGAWPLGGFVEPWAAVREVSWQTTLLQGEGALG